jgi:hypothetical protein
MTTAGLSACPATAKGLIVLTGELETWRTSDTETLAMVRKCETSKLGCALY